MRAIHLAIKDLTQILRDRKATMFLVLMPVVFTALMGFALKAPEQQDTRLPVALANQDADKPDLSAFVEADADDDFGKAFALGFLDVDKPAKRTGDRGRKVSAGEILRSLVERQIAV
jgi:hypothetical protein